MRCSSSDRCVFVLGACLGAGVGLAQQVPAPEAHPGGILFVVSDESGLVSNDSPLYLASNHGGWNPGDAATKLSGRSDLRWQVLLPGPVGEPPLAFKFTRGSWETCEVAADLADISNRTLSPVDATGLASDRPIVVELTIERFADEREGAAKPQLRDDTNRALRVTGRAVRVQVVGGAGAAVGAVRDVIVWLPPGYDDPVNADRRYPVLYMQDGQNVFDFRPPTPGEWQADETATRLIEAGKIQPIIIAAVPHSGANRMVEYLPGQFDPSIFDEPGHGERYIDWLVGEVVPRVERAVRASSDPEDRGIGGSSLGALIALRGGQMYPHLFGRVLAESPAMRFGGRLLPMGGFEGWRARTFLGFGGREFGTDNERTNLEYMALGYKLGSLLAGVRGPSKGERVRIDCGVEAQHNEHAWADRFDDALLHLYGVHPQ